MPERRLRLALFTDSLHPSGVGRVMEALARCLPASRYEIFLICADHPGADELAERLEPYVACTARFTVRWDEDVICLPELVAQLTAWRIDIFHNHIGATWEGDWGTIAARCAHVPVVVATDHLPCVLQISHELQRRRQVNRLLDRLFAVSESVRQSLIADGLMEADRVITIDNGVEPPKRGAEREITRQRLGIPAEAPLTIFVGRLVEQKDPHVLLRAIAILRQRNVAAYAVFAGDGWLRDACEEEAMRLGILNHIRFLGNCAEVGDLMAAGDVLAMPSQFEGMPLAALEAMSLGMPIVACDAPGVRDVVTPDVNGWLGPIADVNAFADGLERAFTPHVGLRWGKAGRERYMQRFTAEHMAARHDQAYQDALAREECQT